MHYLEGLDCDVKVKRNDEIDLNNLEGFDKIILSPGPGLPKESGQLLHVIDRLYGQKAILGVCLGFQAIIEYLGGELYNQKAVKHGVAEPCTFNIDSKLFQGMSKKSEVGLYHSWAAVKNKLPESLKATAHTDEGVLMAFEDTDGWLAGVQFHPESIMTTEGKQIVHNFLSNFN